MNSQKRVVCVDLDGTLVKEETHVMFLRWAWRKRRSFFWRTMMKSLLRGSKVWKEAFAKGYLVTQKLPLSFNGRLIERLRKEKDGGTILVLITGAPQCVAEEAARQLDLFNVVFASTPKLNCVGRVKERLLTQHYGKGGYIYVGNSWRDIYPWRSASTAWVVGNNRLVRWLVRRYCRRILWLTFSEQ